mmetsp:Transcript_2526/g.3623  ORF Transcript_2526/g.3623 Transcript_2526/m.3623 type:complete len:103 (+) Transcript_2526:376-684(+)
MHASRVNSSSTCHGWGASLEEPNVTWVGIRIDDKILLTHGLVCCLVPIRLQFVTRFCKFRIGLLLSKIQAILYGWWKKWRIGGIFRENIALEWKQRYKGAES